MDKKTLIGLGLIGVILALYTWYNQPSKEELIEQAKTEKARLEKETAEVKKQIEADSIKSIKVETPALASSLVPVMIYDADSNFVQRKDSLGNNIFNDSITGRDTSIVAPKVNTAVTDAVVAEGKIISIENDKMTVELSSKGGRVASVFLKEYETYDNAFDENKEKDGEITPLQLFESQHSVNELAFPMGTTNFTSGDKMFELVNSTEKSATYKLALEGGKSIEFIYTLADGAYDMAYEIKMNGFNDVTSQNVMLNWETNLLQSERLLSEQRRVSTVFFKNNDDSYDYLSEYSEDAEVMEDKVDWVAFKQSYFSSIMMPENQFGKEGSRLAVNVFEEGDSLEKSHIKNYRSEMNLNIGNPDNGYAKINWFFGPNDYDVLAAYDNETDDIINLGWGIFRWVNIYAIQPLFNFLAGTGMNLGLAILLLTLCVKVFLTPIQWKMYVSSAKMRILKPEMEEIKERYPNKEDAMKKQMETMALYRESGASPLAGCVPMLIQMPILFAVFRFFPSSFTLRQEGFLWAEDLSSYDSVWDFGFDVWMYGDHMSLFTLLMAGTTLIYTMLNSSNMQQPTQEGMPNMKYIMYFFPIMMIFFFNNFASGLSYYYFISTLTSILLMLAIKKFFVNEDKLKAKMAERRANRQAESKGGPKKKSKFQERLENMQKVQQERMNEKKGKK